MQQAETITASPPGAQRTRNYARHYGWFIVPAAVVRATIEMALRASTDATLIEDQGRVITRERVDVLETEYSEFGPRNTSYTAVARMLSPYTNSSSGGAFASVTVVRT